MKVVVAASTTTMLVVFALLLCGVSSDKMETHSFDGPFEEVDKSSGKRMVNTNWSTGGSAEVLKHFVRLTPDRQSKRGYVWSNSVLGKTDFAAVVAFRISGQGKRWFGDGIGIWLTQHGAYQPGQNHGFTEKYIGVGIILDTFVNSDHKGGHKDITVVVNDGTKNLDMINEETKVGCDAAMRYHEGHGGFDPVYSSSRLKIQVKDQQLILSIDEKATGDWVMCYTGDIALPSGWLSHATLGMTAATGSLADNHDILRVTSYDRSDDPDISTSDSDAMIHHISKDYDKWMDTESCGVECKISIMQKKMKDFQVEFEHKVTDLKEKTENTVQKLREKEHENENKIEELEEMVNRMVDQNVDRRISHFGKAVERKIETKVTDNVVANSGTWKAPFFLLVTTLCGGSFFLYKKLASLYSGASGWFIPVLFQIMTTASYTNFKLISPSSSPNAPNVLVIEGEMAFDLNEIKETVEKCLRTPKLLITYFWVASLLFGVLFSIGAIVFAANNNGGGPTDDKSLGFAAIWMMFMVIGLSVGGTMVMRKYQNRFAVGLFTGVVVMMALNMFSLMILFAGAASRARNDPEHHGAVHSDEAAATFSFFMFFLYSIFFFILVKHRHIIIKEDDDLENGNIETSIDMDKQPANAIGSAAKTMTTAPMATTAAPPVSV